MRLVTFSEVGTARRPGVWHRHTNTILDLAKVAPDGPGDVQGWIERDVADGSLRRLASERGTVAVSEVRLHAPISVPRRNILCAGKNYHEHAEEFDKSGFDASAGKSRVPDHPIIFTKWPEAVIGPGDAIDSALDPTQSTDYEGELCLVIGEGGRAIASGDALGHVYGYTILNDVTARSLQSRHRQWFLGKSIDTFCPMGPCIVTADEIPNPTELLLQTHVNGELRQNARVSDLIFDIPTLIATISRSMTLAPGDLIATGTCAGVGIGFNPPQFLRPGDTVSITIEPIGTLNNPVR
jgi:2-keto-4-pentenoate hydratase/2-oxohepta-3-ene-1,7-dioic acid hydratase in catechol pathway